MNGIQVFACDQHKLQNEDFGFSVFISTLLTAGFSKIFWSAFFRNTSMWVLYAVGGFVICLLSTWIYSGKYKELVFPIECAVLLAAFLARLKTAKEGVFILLNQYLTHLTGKEGKIYLDYPTGESTTAYYIAGIITALIAILAANGVYHGKTMIIYGIVLICFWGTMKGFFLTDYGWILITVGLIYLLFYQRFKISSIKRQKITFLVSLLLVAICVGVGSVLALGFNINTKYHVARIKRSFHENRYDDNANAMPEGQLSNLGEFVGTPEPSLIVTMEQPQKMYLRGLTADLYTGTAWTVFDDDVYVENESTFYWLHKYGFFGQNILGNAYELVDTSEKYSMTVTNVSACREHQYLPYALVGSDNLDAQRIGDGTAYVTESDSQELVYVAGSVPEWYAQAAYLAGHQSEPSVDEYLQLEQTYRTFVYANNLQITNNVVGVFNRLLGEDTQEKSLSEILALIRDTLDTCLTYNESIETLNGSNDFLQYTIEQSKEGYSVHYATAATLMLRYFGVPARYVEGYYMSTEEAAAYEPGENIELSERHAHAWAEYYLDGVGWLPFEVTPGYIDEDEVLAAAISAADSMGNGGGQSYNKNPLTYTPPKAPEDETQLPDLNSWFRFEAQYVVSLLLIIIIFFIIAIAAWILHRRIKLIRFFKITEKEGPREFIIERFAYALMLMETCNIAPTKHWSAARLVNQEALFSTHTMDESQKKVIDVAVSEVVAACKSQQSIWKRFKNHFILWRYR